MYLNQLELFGVGASWFILLMEKIRWVYLASSLVFYVLCCYYWVSQTSNFEIYNWQETHVAHEHYLFNSNHCKNEELKCAFTLAFETKLLERERERALSIYSIWKWC